MSPRLRTAAQRALWKHTPAALAIAALCIGLQVATLAFASLCARHPALGPHFGGLFPPWSIVLWVHAWGSSSDVARVAVGAGIMVSSLIMLAAVAYTAVLKRYVNHYTHGSARWATLKDIRAAKLLSGGSPRSVDGVYVGAFLHRGRRLYLRHSGPEHILTYAPTRSGKTLGPVFMTLLSWRHSAFVLDLKGEIAQVTSGWRKHYARNRILIFEPAHEGSIRWNPLNEIDVSSPTAVGDAQNLATLIVDPDGRGLEDHWAKVSQSLITGLILYVLHKALDGGPAATLAQIDAELANPHRSTHQLWAEMASMDAENPVIAATGKDMIDRPDEEGGSVLSTAKSFLSLYRDPIVARNTSASDFQVRDLMHHDSPVTLYLVTQPTDKARLRPLVRVLCNNLVRKLATRMEYTMQAPARRWWQLRAPAAVTRAKANYKHRLLMMLDEFPSIGRLPILQEALAYLAGYGIKVYILVQDIVQLRDRQDGYGPDEKVTSSCHVQTAYPPNRLETAEHLSRLTGTATVLREQITVSGSGLKTRSRTMQESQRPLLTPDECLRMAGPKKAGGEEGSIVAPGDMLVSVTGYPVIYGQQPLSILDPTFRARMAVPPVPSDSLRKAEGCP